MKGMMMAGMSLMISMAMLMQKYMKGGGNGGGGGGGGGTPQITNIIMNFRKLPTLLRYELNAILL